MTIDFDLIQEKLIAPALESAGLAGGTTGEIIDAGKIREDMFALIIEADLVVADVTVHNANVFYELGIRHALRKRCSVMTKGEPVKDSTPFDLLTDRYVPYCIADPGNACAELTTTLLATMASERAGDRQSHFSDVASTAGGGPGYNSGRFHRFFRRIGARPSSQVPAAGSASWRTT